MVPVECHPRTRQSRYTVFERVAAAARELRFPRACSWTMQDWGAGTWPPSRPSSSPPRGRCFRCTNRRNPTARWSKPGAPGGADGIDGMWRWRRQLAERPRGLFCSPTAARWRITRVRQPSTPPCDDRESDDGRTEAKPRATRHRRRRDQQKMGAATIRAFRIAFSTRLTNPRQARHRDGGVDAIASPGKRP